MEHFDFIRFIPRKRWTVTSLTRFLLEGNVFTVWEITRVYESIYVSLLNSFSMNSYLLFYMSVSFYISLSEVNLKSPCMK